jgi:hypothetical protein
MAATKEKGDLGQAMVMADLFRRGFTKILIPVGEDWRFDLVVYRGSVFERVQCKYDYGAVKGAVIVRAKSCNNWQQYKYTSEDIDWLAVYHKPTDKVYYVPSKLLGKGRACMHLRYEATRNNQKDKILNAEDFNIF